MEDSRQEDPAHSSLLVNIGEMIDMAIGSPEVGVVDFNMLQSVLHVLAQQLRILDKNVEIHGNVGQLPVPKDKAQTVAIKEYIVQTDQTEDPERPNLVKVEEGKFNEEELTASVVPDLHDTLLVVNRVKRGDTRPQLTTIRSPAEDSRISEELSTKPPVKPSGSKTKEKISLVSASKFNILEKRVADLQNRVYGSIPKNEDILEEVRSQTNTKSITDMWTSLNVSTRLEAAETGLNKLSSLLQDLIGDAAKIELLEKKPLRKEDTANVDGVAPKGLAETTSAVRTAPSVATGIVPRTPPVLTEDMSNLNFVLQNLRADLDELTANFYSAMEEQGLEIPQTAPVSVLYATAPGHNVPSHRTETGQSQSSVSTRTPSPLPEAATTQTPDLKTQATETPGHRRTSEKPRKTFGSGSMNTRLSDLEKRLNECCEHKIKTDEDVHMQLNNFQDQLEYLSKQIATLSQDVTASKSSEDFLKNVEGLMNLVETIHEMQSQLKEVHEKASKLSMEKEEKREHINTLLEQIELLKTIKLDREDMIEALADKADLRQLARKVSHDQFEYACDDLTRGVERALDKLTVQETLWQQALDDIQREMEAKLDKMELSPVKEFFNNKLKKLKENLKQMADLRREVEAAGTKKRLLRDVNCISCDAKVVMSMETSGSLPVSKPMPPNLSMKPYLSYELDAIRKQQTNNVPQRNMHDWEHIDKQMQQPKQLTKVRADTDKHLCNRYCGGSHTTTTPSQRVVRLGHFIRQWGPEVVPLSSGMATGDDGRMYKITTENTETEPIAGVDNQPVTPKSPKKNDVLCTKPSQPVKPDCRCLEENITK